MEILKKYGYVLVFIAGAYSLLGALNVPEHRALYLSTGVIQLAAGVMLMRRAEDRS